MDSRTSATDRASPNVTGWHAVECRPGIAEIRDGEDGIVAIVVNLPEPARALPCARLMAAGPALLEVCQRVVAGSEHATGCPAIEGEACRCYYSTAVAVVAAATGEDQP